MPLLSKKQPFALLLMPFIEKEQKSKLEYFLFAA